MPLQAKFKGFSAYSNSRAGALKLPQSGDTIIIPVNSIKKIQFNENGMPQYLSGEDGIPATFYMEYGSSTYLSHGYNLRAIEEMYKAALAGQYASYDEFNQLYPREDTFPEPEILEQENKNATQLGTASSSLEIGKMVEGKGIYIGVHEITTKDGLKKVFNLYASPEKLMNSNYFLSVKTLNKKKNWHGYDGECFRNDKELEKALAEETYKGGWFIPTREILIGNLYGNKDEGDLRGTFIPTRTSHRRGYWSCTEHPQTSSRVCGVNFTDGSGAWWDKDLSKLFTRPVRAELRPS